MVLAGQIDRAREAAQRAVTAGERQGNDQALSQGLQALAMVALAGGFVDRAVTLRAAGGHRRPAQRSRVGQSSPVA